MYLDHGQTCTWLEGIRTAVGDRWEVEIAVLPSFVSIIAACDLLHGSSIQVGAQDCCWAEQGAYTGEVSPSTLKDLGCSYVEVGHAERRSMLHEDDALVAAKTAAARRSGLTPIICVGELHESDPAKAADTCIAQLGPTLAGIPATDQELIIAYEPVWAIGADAPASPDYVNAVVSQVRESIGERARTRIIYGGSAGTGLFASLTATDGLFLGRSALDVSRFAAIVEEVSGVALNRRPPELPGRVGA